MQRAAACVAWPAAPWVSLAEGRSFSIGVVAKNAEAPLADLWLVLGGVSAGFGALTLFLKRSAKPSTFILIE